MGEEKEPSSKTFNLSIDTVIKLIGLAILLLGYVFNFGRKDDKTDLLITHDAELDTKQDGFAKDLQALKDRVLRLEVLQDAKQRNEDQEKSLRQQIKK